MSKLGQVEMSVAHRRITGEVPEGWDTKRLGDACSKIGSGATPRGGKDSYSSSGISLIRSQNVLNEGFSESGLAFIDDSQAKELDNVALMLDDVLLNITGESVARCCMVPGHVLPARVNQHVSIIRTIRDCLDPEFLRYFLISPKMQQHMLALASSGATRQALTKGMIENFEISSPSLDEQRSIAKILSDLDEKIELNHRMNKTLETIAQGIFRQWFMEQDNAKRYSSVADLVEFDPQVTAKKGEVLPYVDMKALSTEGMGVDGIVLRLFSGGAKFQNNDTLFARITPCLENGKTAFVNFLNGENPVGFGSTEFIVMRPKEGISPQFVYCLARHLEFRLHAIQSMVGSSGRQRVQLNMLKSYELLRPAQDSMNKFHKATLPLFSKINENRKEIQALSQIRDSLLPKLMSGKIRVKRVRSASNV